MRQRLSPVSQQAIEEVSEYSSESSSEEESGSPRQAYSKLIRSPATSCNPLSPSQTVANLNYLVKRETYQLSQVDKIVEEPMKKEVVGPRRMKSELMKIDIAHKNQVKI